MCCGFSDDLFMQKVGLIKHYKFIRMWEAMLDIFTDKRKRSKIRDIFRIVL